MPCALTQGYTPDCRDGAGGTKEVYIVEIGGIDSISVVSGVVTGITKKAGKKFFKYQLPRETANATETGAGSEQNGTFYVTQNVQIILNKRQASVRNEVQLLAQTNVVIVVVENTGKAFLFGKEFGLTLLAPVSDTGTAWADRNGYTLPFTGNEKEFAPEVAASVIAALETPGS